MIENGLFDLGGSGTQLHDILWSVHDGKNVVEARERKISGSSRLRWVVGGRAMCVFSRTHTRVGARHWALTEPERGVCLLNPSDCTAGYALLNPSDRSMAVN